MLVSRAPTFGFLFLGGVRFFRALRAYIKAFKDLGCAAGFQVERLLFHGVGQVARAPSFATLPLRFWACVRLKPLHTGLIDEDDGELQA